MIMSNNPGIHYANTIRRVHIPQEQQPQKTKHSPYDIFSIKVFSETGS